MFAKLKDCGSLIHIIQIGINHPIINKCMCRSKGDLFLRLCSSFTKSRIMSSSNLQQQQQQPISAAPIPGELGGTVSNDQPTASLKPPTPNQLSAAKTKSKTSLSSALNLNQKQGSKPVLNNSDGMKLQNTGSTKVLADQHELKAIEPIRRIITEDLRWNFGMPKPLTDCCLNSIRKNVTGMSLLFLMIGISLTCTAM